MRRSQVRGLARLLRVDTFLVTLVLALLSLFTHYYYEGELPFEKLGFDVPRSEEGQAASTESLAPAEKSERSDYVRTIGAALEEDLQPPAQEPKRLAPLRFMMFNVENYFVYGEPSRAPYRLKLKSARSRDAVAALLASTKADVVGLIEMGGQLALKDLRERLEALGQPYPYYRILERYGDPRALALLSKKPIVKDCSRAHYGLYSNHRRRMLRGILDLEVELEDGRQFCIVGAHLKSRVSADAAAASSLRGQEARTLAMYLNERMKASPKLPILVFGDWNDGPADASLGVLSQGVAARSALVRLPAKDAMAGEWTYYYSRGKKYYIFDQIYVNSVLKQRLASPLHSGIVGDTKASDHRAVWCEIR